MTADRSAVRWSVPVILSTLSVSEQLSVQAPALIGSFCCETWGTAGFTVLLYTRKSLAFVSRA